jgi:putative hemolysin
MIVLLQALGIITCIIIVGMFSGMETGVISINRMRLRHSQKQGSRAADILTGFLANTDRLLGTTLVGTNLFTVMATVLAVNAATHWFCNWGEPVATACMALLLLVFGEYLPKSWFYSKPLERCIPFASFLRTAETILHPLGMIVLAITRVFLPGESSVFHSSDPFITREELKDLANEGARHGVLTTTESTMIRRVFDLSGKRVEQIMIPRSRMTYVCTTTTLEDFVDIARKAGFTRYPVYDEASKVFVGIANVYYVLAHLHAKGDNTVGAIVRAPLFVPDNMPVDDVLPRMRRSRHPMCLVRNADSKTIGMLTTEDIMEQIVGRLT